MKRTELMKISAIERRKISKTYGFRQSGHINWTVESGYFFYIQSLRLEDVTLMVKPIYVDDLWWEIFGIAENKNAPMSLRGTGAFSVFGKMIATYGFLSGNIEQYSRHDIEAIWPEIFNSVKNDIAQFLQSNPDVDAYMPDKEEYSGGDNLMYFMTLLHNGKKEEVVRMIKAFKSECHHCLFRSDGMDSYDFILKWCEDIE